MAGRAPWGWIDTHCHLDAPEFSQDLDQVWEQAKASGVVMVLVPTVQPSDWEPSAQICRRLGLAYTLGLHPLFVSDHLRRCEAEGLGSLQHPEPAIHQLADSLERAIEACIPDRHFVGVGEVGLDYWVPRLREPVALKAQNLCFEVQLEVARRQNCPLTLHVRKSADALTHTMRKVGKGHTWRGVVHAFNGSYQQAVRLLDMGLKLGAGGAHTYERAANLRDLWCRLPLSAWVIETDAPDMPPQWIYVNAEQRSRGLRQARNTPGELARVATTLADLRGLDPAELMNSAWNSSLEAFPKLSALLDGDVPPSR